MRLLTTTKSSDTLLVFLSLRRKMWLLARWAVWQGMMAKGVDSLLRFIFEYMHDNAVVSMPAVCCSLVSSARALAKRADRDNSISRKANHRRRFEVQCWMIADLISRLTS